MTFLTLEELELSHIVQLRNENKRMHEVIRKHYPTIAGHVIRLQDAHEDRAADEWNQVALDFYEFCK